jgi:hypothetical protein
VRLDGRPVFVVYAPYEMPDISAVVRVYRAAFAQRGLNPQIGFCASYVDPALAAHEFDFCLEFQPRLFFNVMRGLRKPHATNAGLYLKRRLPWLYEKLTGLRDRRTRAGATPRKYLDYSDYLGLLERDEFVRALREAYGLPVVRSLFYSWNNYPRYRGGALAVRHQPGDYEKFLALASRWTASEPWFLLNSWNEWSEGAALEPGGVAPERYESS